MNSIIERANPVMANSFTEYSPMEAYNFAIRNINMLCQEDLDDLAVAVANGSIATLKFYWTINMKLHQDIMLDSFLNDNDCNVDVAADWAFEIRNNNKALIRIKTFIVNNNGDINEFIHRYNYALRYYLSDSSPMTMDSFYSDLPELYKLGVLI